MRIAVVGATGMTGQALLKLLPESRIKYDELVLLGSERSEGETTIVGRRKHEIRRLAKEQFKDVNLAFFAVGDELSEKYVPVALECGAVVVDKSSVYRMRDDVPLVVVGVNESEVSSSRLISNPNCTTIMLAHSLFPLTAFGLREVHVASYQSMSGAGRDEVESFLESIGKLKAEDRKNPESPKLAQIFKAVPGIGPPFHLDYQEEKKIREETSKILNLDETEIYATAVRVPTLVGHCIACFIKLNYRASIEDIRLALEEHKYIELLPSEEIPDSTLALSVPDKVVVGRVRSYFEEKCVCLFAVSNNLVIGAALNALLIGECKLAMSS